MQPVLHVDDIKRVEIALTRAGVSVSELMHRAGYAAAQEVAELDQVQSVVVLCGLGNNGGDGWVAATALHERGIATKVVSPVAPDQLASDLTRQVAQTAIKQGVEALVGPSRLELEQLLGTCDVVVDCMLGTGFHGAVRAPFDIWINCVNECDARVVSVDVPSGLSAQTGEAAGEAIFADVTVTMIALKLGLLADAGRDRCGAIVVAPLAEQTERLVREADPVAWRLEYEDYEPALIQPQLAVDKFTRGSVLVVGGSRRFAGAPVLAARAAARAGAGYVTLAVPAGIAPLVQMQVPEIPVIALPEDTEGTIASGAAELVAQLATKRTVTLVGPGMRVSGGTCAVTSALLNANKPLVIDADGLNCLARLTDGDLPGYPELTRRTAPLVLTPHRGELGRLVGGSSPTSLAAQLEAARAIIWSDGGVDLTVVSKSNASACVGVSRAVLPKPGPLALATAGSGDVLGGIIASLFAQAGGQVRSGVLTCALACEIHALAGELAARDLGSKAVMASDIVDRIGLASDEFDASVSYPTEAK